MVLDLVCSRVEPSPQQLHVYNNNLYCILIYPHVTCIYSILTLVYWGSFYVLVSYLFSQISIGVHCIFQEEHTACLRNQRWQDLFLHYQPIYTSEEHW